MALATAGMLAACGGSGDGSEGAGITTTSTAAAVSSTTPAGLDGYSYFTLSVYFENEADARAAVTAFAAHGVDGVAGQVETFCLD